MKTKQLLSFSVLLLNFSIIILLLYSVFLIFITFHSESNSNPYRNIVIENHYNLLYLFNQVEDYQSYEAWKQSSNKFVYYIYLDTLSKIKLLIYNLIFISFLILIFKKLIQFFKSINQISTFYITNSKLFYTIGIILIIKMVFGLLINAIGIGFTMEFPDGSLYTQLKGSLMFSSLFIDMLMALLAIAASVVFKEGEKMKNEIDLTI